MAKFEYLVLTIADVPIEADRDKKALEQWLNDLGQRGWKLCDSDGRGTRTFVRRMFQTHFDPAKVVPVVE